MVLDGSFHYAKCFFQAGWHALFVEDMSKGDNRHRCKGKDKSRGQRWKVMGKCGRQQHSETPRSNANGKGKCKHKSRRTKMKGQNRGQTTSAEGKDEGQKQRADDITRRGGSS